MIIFIYKFFVENVVIEPITKLGGILGPSRVNPFLMLNYASFCPCRLDKIFLSYYEMA
jgi:hypothetical protein